MDRIVMALGAVQILGGIAVYSVARSAIHEILGSISFGMGVLSAALGIAIGHLIAIRKATERQVEIFDAHKRNRA